jgi:amino acid adenylation domain-containing protein/non-ribosomal peptide synthase protein (TIGR01720 family)
MSLQTDKDISGNDDLLKRKEFWSNKLTSDHVGTKLYSTHRDDGNPGNISNVGVVIPVDLSDQILKIVKNSDVSLYIFLVTIINILLSKYTENEDITVVSPVYNPDKTIKTPNYCIISNTVKGGISFKDLLFKIRECVLEAFENQDYPLEMLLKDVFGEAEKSKRYFSKVYINLKNIHDAKIIENIQDNVVFCCDRSEKCIEFNTFFDLSKYEKCYIEQITRHFMTITSNVINDVNVKISDIEYLSEAERKNILLNLNDTKSDYDIVHPIHKMIENMVKQSGKKTAVVFQDNTISYAELNEKANALACRLLDLGVKKGSLVPVLMKKCIELPISLLAIMKAGAAFVPVEIAWPRQRIIEILNEVNSPAVLLGKDLNHLQFAAFKSIYVDSERLDSVAENLDVQVGLDDPIYVIYTSGSTGKPKGAINKHRGIVNRFLYMNKRYKCAPNDVVLLTSNHVFDAAVWQLFWPLINGIKTVIPTPCETFDIDNIVAIIAKEKVTITDFVPSVFNLLVNMVVERIELADKLKSLRQLLIGGESMTSFHVYKFKSYFPQCGITNTYGPAETSIGTIFYEVPAEYVEPIPIGRPIDNVKVLILDGALQPVPLGAPGELYLGGECVGLGYVNDTEKTNKAFIEISIEGLSDTKFYKTGDKARYLFDGNIEFLGRFDDQVKIRGIRIEPREIENRLLGHAAIKEAAVIVKDDEKGDKFLCAYTVLRNDQVKHGTEAEPRKRYINLRDFDLKDILKQDNANDLNDATDVLAAVINDVYDSRHGLTKDEKTRYSRQLLLDGWGIAGQERLKGATVFVAGAGGTGSPTIMQLALAGVGTIVICDFDNVEASNLARQCLHDATRIGMNKALSAKETINRLNPDINVVAITEKITKENVADLIGDSDFIFENTDDPEAQLAISEYAVANRIPCAFASMIDLSSFAIIMHTPHTPCFHCLYDRNKLFEAVKIQTEMAGYNRTPFAVTASSLFTCTGFVVTEALKIILNIGQPAYNKFFLFNQKGSENFINTAGFRQITYPYTEHFRNICKDHGFDWDKGWTGKLVEEIPIKKDPSCPVCGNVHKVKADIDKKGDRGNTTAGHTNSNGNQVGMEVIALLLEERDLVAGVGGALKAGKTYVNLRPDYSEEQMAYIIDDSEARVIVTNNQYHELAVKVRDRVNKRINVLNIDLTSKKGPVSRTPLRMETDEIASIEYLFGISVSDLREYLAGYLPDYMIPSYFVIMDNLPLTPNGKLDHRALPNPFSGMKPRGSTPENDLERIIHSIWCEVLGKESIDTNSNFFFIGGDSIKIIQIASRLRKYGYKIEIRDTFQNPTITSLARMVQRSDDLPEQGIITGNVQLTPVQKEFFLADSTDLHHFNQALLLYSGKIIDIGEVEAVFAKIVEHHDALRISFKKADGAFMQINHGIDRTFWLKEYDYRGKDAVFEQLKTEIDAISASIDLENGPLVKLAIFHLDDGDRLLIVIHHLVVDGVSWRILLSDLSILIRQYEKGETLNLPAKSHSFMVWAEKLHEYAANHLTREELEYWTEMEAVDIPLIKRDFEAENLEKDIRDEYFELQEADTALLLTEVNMAYHTEINDILLTALGLGVADTFGQSRLLLDIEGHGREAIINNVDISRTVGWFTCIYSMVLFFAGDNTIQDYIRETKEALRKVPNKGMGYGMIKYLSGQSDSPNSGFRLKPQIIFNYLGQFDNTFMEMPFEIAEEAAGVQISPNRKRKYDFDITGLVTDKKLRITISYSDKQYMRETVRKLADNYQAQLLNIIRFCVKKQSGEVTPSDLGFKGLTLEQLDNFFK